MSGEVPPQSPSGWVRKHFAEQQRINRIVHREMTVGHRRIETLNFVYRNNVQSIASGVSTSIVWENAFLEEDTMWSAGNPEVILIPWSGVYFFTIMAAFAKESPNQNPPGRRIFSLWKNNLAFPGNVVVRDERSSIPVAFGTPTVTLGGFARFVQGDALRFVVYQDSGGPLDLLEPAGGGVGIEILYRRANG